MLLPMAFSGRRSGVAELVTDPVACQAMRLLRLALLQLQRRLGRAPRTLLAGVVACTRIRVVSFVHMCPPFVSAARVGGKALEKCGGAHELTERQRSGNTYLLSSWAAMEEDTAAQNRSSPGALSNLSR